MKIVLTNKHKIPFQIDEEDYIIVSHFMWRISNNYVATTIGYGRNRKGCLLHQLLLGKAPKGLEWDHIDRNKLNNQRKNFRLVIHRINTINREVTRNVSGFRGICQRYNSEKWIAFIADKPGHKICLGSFSNREDAINVRRAAELEYYGEFCK